MFEVLCSVVVCTYACASVCLRYHKFVCPSEHTDQNINRIANNQTINHTGIWYNVLLPDGVFWSVCLTVCPLMWTLDFNIKNYEAGTILDSHVDTYINGQMGWHAYGQKIKHTRRPKHIVQVYKSILNTLGRPVKYHRYQPYKICYQSSKLHRHGTQYDFG